MRYLIVGVIICVVAGVSDALWCYKCSGTECESPDTVVDGVYITECDDYTSICYKQVITNYGQKIYARGCAARKSDCQPVCLGDSNHEVCEICCDQNLCNGGSTVRGDVIFVILTSLLIGLMFLRR